MKKFLVMGIIAMSMLFMSPALVYASDPGTETYPGVYGIDWGWQDSPDFAEGGYYWIAATQDANEAPTTPTDTTLPPEAVKNMVHEGEYSDPYIYEPTDPEPYLSGTYRMDDGSLMVWTSTEWVNVVIPEVWW